MLVPIKVVDIELSHPIPTFEGLEGYMGLQGLMRLHGVPIGYVKAPIALGRCTSETLSQLIVEHHHFAIIKELLKQSLATSAYPKTLCLEDLFDIPAPQWTGEFPSVTVAVCTRDRPDDLALCLEALGQLDYPNLEILVVDNASQTDATQSLVQTKYPHIRYVCEPRPGLDWARNRAILEAKGEIIAYTDDDVIVDSGWVKALVQVFVENPDVMAATGLIVPYELETEAQVLFEMYGGFGRGFQRKWAQVSKGSKMSWRLMGTGQFGAGANMAYRRCVFDKIGLFDPAMDVGTVTNGGGDLEMFFRILKEGHTLVYEPGAIVRHRHRQSYEKLHTQITNNGIGLYSYFTRSLITYPDSRFSLLYLSVWWLIWWHLRRLLLSWIHPSRFPRELILAELRGFFMSFGRYQQARREAKAIEASFGALPQPQPINVSQQRDEAIASIPGSSVRTVDLSQPIQAVRSVTHYPIVKILVTWGDQAIGSVEINNAYQPISKSRLIEAIVDRLELQLLQSRYNLGKSGQWAEGLTTLAQQYIKCEETPTTGKNSLKQLPDDVSVSVVVCTRDRPAELYDCLQHLVNQASRRPIQIIVVDNNPDSNFTASIVAKFPGVVLLNEHRQGSSYARNRGLLASTGEIIVTLDDDITVPPQWLETLLAPFVRSDVMVVTGNVLPLELETYSQRLFEIYGGLGQGFDRFETNGDWFEKCWYRTIPIWHLGTAANAAFRAQIFHHPQIGLLKETLGVGTLAGGGEDLYLFYKVLKAGHTLVYQPSAYAWHKHVRDMDSFYRLIYNSGKGHVAYQLLTLFQDGDLRVLARLLVGLPIQHINHIYYQLRGWIWYPIWMTLLEAAGNLIAPLFLWRSYLRHRQIRYSDPKISDQRSSLEYAANAAITLNHPENSLSGETAMHPSNTGSTEEKTGLESQV